MTESYSYRGHAIELHFQKLIAGRVRCTYFIDVHYCFQIEMETDIEDVVRTKAVALAHASIDTLDLQCPHPASISFRNAVPDRSAIVWHEGPDNEDIPLVHDQAGRIQSLIAEADPLRYFEPRVSGTGVIGSPLPQ